MPNSNHRTLWEIATINARVREVRNISRSVYITALNAVFQSKQAGDTAKGCATLTGELRTFSTQLNSVMDRLSTSIFEQVRLVAAVQRLSHVGRLYQRAVMASGLSESAMARGASYARKNCTADELARPRGSFQRELRNAARICQRGEVLAVLSKVESASAKTRARELTAVSGEIGETVSKVQELLTEITKKLKRSDADATRPSLGGNAAHTQAINAWRFFAVVAGLAN